MYRGVRLGLGAEWQSGLPFSELRAFKLGFSRIPYSPFCQPNGLDELRPLGYPTCGSGARRDRIGYPTGQRNDQRNPDFWNFDLLIATFHQWFGALLLGLAVSLFAWNVRWVIPAGSEEAPGGPAVPVPR